MGKQYQPGTDPESAFIVAASQFRLGNVEEAASIFNKYKEYFPITRISYLYMQLSREDWDY